MYDSFFQLEKCIVPSSEHYICMALNSEKQIYKIVVLTYDTAQNHICVRYKTNHLVK